METNLIPMPQKGLKSCRQDFPMLAQKMGNKNLIYFDSSATSLKPKPVIDAVRAYYEESSLNIRRSDYDLASNVQTKVEETRKLVAEFIGAKSEKEIVFCSGATMALGSIAYGLGKAYIKEGDVIASTKIEHASAILPWFRVAEEKKASVKFVDLENGLVTSKNLRNFFEENKNTKILALTHVSNVLGNCQDLKMITEIAHEHGALVVADCTQSVPHRRLNVSELDVDFIAFSAHKMLGPTGIGIMYGKSHLLEICEPLLLGGGSNARFDSSCSYSLKNIPYCFESGTPNLAGILGFGIALKYLNKLGLEEIHAHELRLMRYFLQKLEPHKHLIESYHFQEPEGIFTFNVKGIFAQDAAAYFAKNGIAMRAGHHCAKMSGEILPSQETLRISFYIYNTEEEIDYFIECLSQISLEKCIDIYL